MSLVVAVHHQVALYVEIFALCQVLIDDSRNSSFAPQGTAMHGISDVSWAALGITCTACAACAQHGQRP